MRRRQAIGSVLFVVLCIGFITFLIAALPKGLRKAGRDRDIARQREFRHIGERFIKSYQFPVARSPDGRLLLVKEKTADGFALLIYEGRTHNPKLELKSNPFEIEWNRSSSAVAFLSEELQPGAYALHIWKLTGQQAPAVNGPLTKRATFALKWSPDGQHIAYIADKANNSDLVVLKTSGETPTVENTIADVDAEAGMAWSPDSHEIAFIHYIDRRRAPDRFLNTWDLERNTVTNLALIKTGSIRDISWSPASRPIMAYRGISDEFYRLAYASQDGNVVYCAEMNGDVESPTTIDQSGAVHFLLDHDGDQTLEQTTGCESPRAVFHPVSGTMRLPNDGFPHVKLAIIVGNMTTPPRELDIDPKQTIGERRTDSSDEEVSHGKRVWIAGSMHPVSALLWVPQSISQPERRAIVTVHGGPHLHETADWDPFRQAFIDAGFTVLAVNYGGSSGYGSAYEHVTDITSQANDVLAALHFLSAAQGISPDHITLIASSNGTRVVLKALAMNPNACHILVFSPFLAYRADIEGAPLTRFNGITFAFHGNRDPLMAPGIAYSSLLKLSPLESNPEYFHWRQFKDEGHGLARISSLQEEFGTLYCILNPSFCAANP